MRTWFETLDNSSRTDRRSVFPLSITKVPRGWAASSLTSKLSNDQPVFTGNQ